MRAVIKVFLKNHIIIAKQKITSSLLLTHPLTLSIAISRSQGPVFVAVLNLLTKLPQTGVGLTHYLPALPGQHPSRIIPG